MKLIISEKIGIDIWETIDAASSKPFGFMPFKPGPGIGGHCIPIDPLYLQWKAKQFGLSSDFIQLAKKQDTKVINHILNQINSLIDPKIAHKQRKVLIYGVTYKKDSSDLRNSPSLTLIEQLLSKQYNVVYDDPFVSELTISGQTLKSVAVTEELLAEVECVVIMTDHSLIPLQKMIDHATVIYDTKNVTTNKEGKAKIYVLGKEKLENENDERSEENEK